MDPSHWPLSSPRKRGPRCLGAGGPRFRGDDRRASSPEHRDEGGARPGGGREAPALGAGRALPGVAPRAGHLIGQPHRTDAISTHRSTPVIGNGPGEGPGMTLNRLTGDRQSESRVPDRPEAQCARCKVNLGRFPNPPKLHFQPEETEAVVRDLIAHPSGGLPPISYVAGGVENAAIRKAVCDILEGGEAAFRERARRLRVRLDR